MKRRAFLKQAIVGTAAFTTFSRSLALDRSTGNQNDPEADKRLPGEKPVRIAVVQQDGNPGQVEANRKKALGFAETALAQHADVILFHEELLVGYDKNLRELSEPVNGVSTRAFQDLLKGTSSLIIYGLTENDNNNYYISAPVVSEDGLIANYRKTHLWWQAEGLRHEPTFYSPGNKLVTFNVMGYKCGIMICYDGDFPEMTRSYANLGCSMVFWMNNRGSRGHEEVKDLAFGNSMIMAVSCCCGKNEEGNPCPGGSNITGPKGELIAEIWNKEGIILGDIYPGQVGHIRNDNPMYNGLRPELYYYK
jgi:predicted amidohydrolase